MRTIAILLLLASAAVAQPPLVDTSALELRLADIEQRLTALEGPQEPEPDSEPTGDRLTVADLELIGGWRIKQEFPRGGLAIDFKGRRIFSGGLGLKSNQVHVYGMPDMGTGTDIESWPIVKRLETIDEFWDPHPEAYAGGLQYKDDVLWVSTRRFYNAGATSGESMTLEGLRLATNEKVTQPVPLIRAAFGGGFIKGHKEWLIGCGGYASGSNSVAGPTVAKVDGTVLLNQALHGTMEFGKRTIRESNYSAAQDSWLALNPREVDGKRVGQWAADRIYGGGIWHPRGVLFWALMGVGELDYTVQKETFSVTDETQVYLYTYDAEKFDGVQYEEWPYPMIHGHAVGPNGLLYLLGRNAWRGSFHATDSAVMVFRIKGGGCG